MGASTIEYAEHFETAIFDWNYKTYLLLGSYGSSKSYNAALKIILKLLQEKRRAAVIREVFETHLESTYQLLQEVSERVDPSGKYIQFKKSPLSVEFYNGSKIIFKGADKVEKMKGLQSVSVVWLEEASELKYNAYKELLLRLRTKEQSLHIILTTNPVSEDNWIYTHFFKNEELEKVFIEPEDMYEQRIIRDRAKDLFVHHSTVDDNPFVPDTYVKELDKMKEYDPDLYRVARLGRFGVLGEKVFNNVEKRPAHEVTEALNNTSRLIYKQGGDFGYITSYNATIWVAVDHENKYLYIYKERYKRGESDEELANDLLQHRKEIFVFDSSEPKSIAYLQQRGLRVIPAKKGPGSVRSGMKKLKRFHKIIISSDCPNAWREFSTITYAKDKSDNIIEDKYSLDGHLIDSCRYSLHDYEVASVKGSNTYKKGRIH